jgi:hypothetical protein
MNALVRSVLRASIIAGLFFSTLAHAEIEFHCKELTDTLLNHCKFAILVQNDTKADFRFTIKQGEVKQISDVYLGRKYCFDRGFEQTEQLPIDDACGNLYIFSPLVQNRNLDALRPLEISIDEQRLSCVSSLWVRLEDGCLFRSKDQSVFVKAGASTVTKLFFNPVPFCVLPIQKNQIALSFEECKNNKNSKQYLSGRFNQFESTYEEPTFEQLIAKDPEKPSYFAKFNKAWFESVGTCLTDKNSTPKPELVFIQFINSDQKLIGQYTGIPRATEEVQIRGLCKGKWRLHPSFDLINSASIGDVQIKTNEDLIKAIEEAREQMFTLANSLGLSVKLKIRNYGVYQEIYADVNVTDINGAVTPADELAIGLSEFGLKPMIQRCNGQSFCSAHDENYVRVAPNKDICVFVKAKKNGVESNALLDAQPGSACTAFF